MIPPILGMPKFALQIGFTPWAIGLFIMEWGKHERLLAGLISQLEQRDYLEVRDSLLDGQLADYEKRLLKSIEQRTLSNAVTDCIHEILPKHIELRRIRRDIVHGLWAGLNEDQEYVLKRKERNVGEYDRVMSCEEILGYYQGLQSLAIMVVNAQRMVEGKPPLTPPNGDN